jgi:hypothetical protein
MVYGRIRTIGGHRVSVPPSDWLWSPEPVHPAIVDRATWDAAQPAGKEHATSRDGGRLSRHPAAKRAYAYRGRVRCRDCRRRMAGGAYASTARTTVYYQCPHNPANPRHAAANPDHPPPSRPPKLASTRSPGYSSATTSSAPAAPACSPPSCRPPTPPRPPTATPRPPPSPPSSLNQYANPAKGTNILAMAAGVNDYLTGALTRRISTFHVRLSHTPAYSTTAIGPCSWQPESERLSAKYQRQDGRLTGPRGAGGVTRRGPSAWTSLGHESRQTPAGSRARSILGQLTFGGVDNAGRARANYLLVRQPQGKTTPGRSCSPGSADIHMTTTGVTRNRMYRLPRGV